MHELSLLGGVVKAVESIYATSNATAVEVVALRVGTLSGTLPDALHQAWPLATAGSVVDGARLDIEEIPAAVWCPVCDKEQLIDQFFAFTCPVCASPTAALRRGREFEVAYAEFTTTEPE